MKRFLSAASPALRGRVRLFAAPGLVFLLSAAQLDGCCPFSLALTAIAGPGLPGLLCLAGAAGGAWLFLDFQPGLRYLACAVLTFAAATAFSDTRYADHRRFPLLSSLLSSALVQSVYLIGRSWAHTLVFLATLGIQAVACVVFPAVFSGGADARCRKQAFWLLLGATAMALLPLSSSSGFSLGRCVMTAAVLLAASASPSPQGAVMGFCAGLAVDLSFPRPAPLFTLIATAGGALAALTPSHRLLSGGTYCLSTIALAVALQADKPEIFLWEAMGGAFLFLLLPRRIPQRIPEKVQTPTPLLPPAQNRLEQSAAAFRDLYDSFFRGISPTPAENPSVIFDRAAEQVCRGCVLCNSCWQQNYHGTYNAFNDACPALLRRGLARPQDFPLYFTSRCVHLQPFLAAVNTELRAFLLRRQYHRQLLDVRRQAQEQYAQLGDLLADAAAEAMAETSTPLGYRVGSVLRPRQDNPVCGDQLAVFEAGSKVYLLISDGMGSGEAAHREAAMTVRLLRQFLQAGIHPGPALKTLNAALALRGEDGGGFTTIDLLELQRSDGSAALYKYGAAPSYLKRGGSVSRFTAAGLPAGLHSGDQPPDCTRLSLPPGSFFVMVSDGIADQTDDEWLQNLLAGWSGANASALTSLILAESRSRKGLQDDCAVIVLYLPPGGGEKQQI